MESTAMDHLRRVKKAHEDRLLALPGVVGVDIGRKWEGGRKTETLAIRVYVTEKRDMPAEQAIPDQLDGVPIDVIERRFRAN